LRRQISERGRQNKQEATEPASSAFFRFFKPRSYQKNGRETKAGKKFVGKPGGAE